MGPGARQLFVYYRLDPGADAAAVIAAVQAAQRELTATQPGLQARLYRRQDAGVVTVMETYACDRPQGVDAALQDRIERRLAAALVPHPSVGPRHLEAFDPVPCAS